jgi:hypothetical protein
MTPKIHLITPFMRHHLKATLIEAYGSMDILWHPIVFQDEHLEFDASWIIPYVIPMNRADCKTAMPQYTMRNYWIQNNEIIDDDYYVTVDDDDMYESGVFDAVRRMNDDIVIISMKRGHFIPKDVIIIRRYPTRTLIAHPDNVRQGEISSQQSFVKGKIFKAHLFDDSSQFGDGDMAVHHKEDGEQIAYRPDLFALFNFYEPGRWVDMRPGEARNIKISFGVMVNDPLRLDMVLQKSQFPKSTKCHTITNAESATKGLNLLLGIIEAEGADAAVLTHQDMFYRQGWLAQVKDQIAMLPDSWVVAGIIGKDMNGLICGQFHDMRIPQDFSTKHIHDFPHPASCMDECCIIVNLKKGFRFDETLDGFDLYGTLCVLQAWEMGGSAFIIDAYAEHYCTRSFQWHPEDGFVKNFKWLWDKFKGIRVDSTALGLPPDGEVIFETSAA